MINYNKVEDWKVERIEPGHYAIFHKLVNLEWVDKASGDNLCFGTAREARQYLEKELKEAEEPSLTDQAREMANQIFGFTGGKGSSYEK